MNDAAASDPRHRAAEVLRTICRETGASAEFFARALPMVESIFTEVPSGQWDEALAATRRAAERAAQLELERGRTRLALAQVSRSVERGGEMLLHLEALRVEAEATRDRAEELALWSRALEA